MTTANRIMAHSVHDIAYKFAINAGSITRDNIISGITEQYVLVTQLALDHGIGKSSTDEKCARKTPKS